MGKSEKVAELKDRLQEAMRLRDVKAVDLAKRIDAPKSMISYYVAGRNLPKADRIYKLATALSVSEAWLMGYDVPMERSPEAKKTDDLVAVVQRLRSDSVFFNTVKALAELSEDDYNSIRRMVSALRGQ